MPARRLPAIVAGIALVLGGVSAPIESAVALAPTAAPTLLEPTATHFKNCTKLNQKYKHGVGKKGAKDHVSGRNKPVTNFTRSNALYKANRGLDRDHDGIACEKH